MPLETEFLTIDDIATALKVSRSLVYSMVARGELPKPIYLTKRTLRWRRWEVEECLGIKDGDDQTTKSKPSRDIGDYDW